MHADKHDITREELAAVLIENYDPSFVKLVRSGDIVISGYNFGCGSSREQAATAFLAAGVRIIIAGSFSETFKRNGFNNTLLCIECPSLVDHVSQTHGERVRTVRTEIEAMVDFERSTIGVENESFSFAPLGVAVQELIACGGMEAWVQAQAGSELTSQ